MSQRRVLVISEDPVGREMGGNAIRAFELAKVLAEHADVTLAAPSAPGGQAELEQVPLSAEDPAALSRVLRGADVVLALPQGPVRAAQLRRSDARIVYDLYDPKPLQMLESRLADGKLGRSYWARIALDHTLDALATGAFLICAAERQRDLWLGALLAGGHLTPALYETDRTLRNLLDVVPFGIPSEAPIACTGAAGPRERFPALNPDDEIVLWNGGLWDWLDPASAVEAIALVAERRPRARLLFMGPPPDEPHARAATAAHRLAAERGLLDRVVFFNDRRVPYPERSAWLLAATCAVSLHTEHLETRFSFRTRLLDCFWAGLPVVCTEGDELADLVERERLGGAVAPGRPDLVAGRVIEVLERGRPAYAQALEGVARAHRWALVAEPLVRWLQSGAPERPGGGGSPFADPGRRARAGGTRMLRAAMRTARRLG